MYVVLTYQFEDGDVPSPKDIEESFNLVAEFAAELHRKPEEQSPERRAFNRIVKSGSAFKFSDANIVADYAVKVCKRIDQKYGADGPLAKAPWKESVLQNRRQLQAVMVGLLNLIRQQPLP